MDQEAAEELYEGLVDLAERQYANRPVHICENFLAGFKVFCQVSDGQWFLEGRKPGIPGILNEEVSLLAIWFCPICGNRL